MEGTAPRWLVVSPDTSLRERLALALPAGITLVPHVDPARALQVAGAERVASAVVALDGLGPRGTALLVELREQHPELPVVVTMAAPTAADVLAALRAGAAEFLAQPFDPAEVAHVAQKLGARAERAPATPAPPRLGSSLLGESPALRQALELIRKAAQGTATVLLRGESGTGKELAARALHELSPRSGGPLVKIDCASLPEALLESELFGYEKGAFTGATQRKAGRVELAEGGTLFLDEVGELTASLQAKLLRLLQDREFERLGGTRTHRVDVRVVAATHRDLEDMVTAHQFRQDLFYRLNVVPIWMPPLRARRADVDLLVRHFLGWFGAANGRPGLSIEPEALKALRGQRWPGNVRQLQNFIERLVVLHEGDVVTVADVHGELDRQVSFSTQDSSARSVPRAEGAVAAHPAGAVTATGAGARLEVTQGHSVTASRTVEPRSSAQPGRLDEAVRLAERKALERALSRASGNRSLAARLLGISRSNLYAKLAEHGLE